MLPIIYGISNCDTVRKARKWLADQGIEHQFVDVRDLPPTRERIGDWIASVGKDVLVNKRSKIWIAQSVKKLKTGTPFRFCSLIRR